MAGLAVACRRVVHIYRAEAGDVIVKFDGKDVKESRDLPRLVASMAVGRQVEVVVVRNGNAYRNRYIGVVRFRDGKISHWREFHDPRATDVL